MRMKLGQAIRITEPNSVDPARLISAALIKLYLSNDVDTHIDEYRASGATFLHKCVTGLVTAQPNDVQETLTNLAPNNRILHLYIAAWGNKPSHYVVLHKDTTDNLWKVKCRRICEIPAGAKARKDGVLMHLRNSDPSIAVGLAPSYERIFSGGQSILDLDRQLKTDYELRRELSLSCMVASLFTDRLDFPVWMQPGKSVFQIIEPLPENPFLEPYNFECIRTRPYASNISKPQCIIWADCPDEDEYMPTHIDRHIVPQVKNSAPARFEDNFTQGILDELLLTRIVPFVGIYDAATKRVAVYGLSYDPDKQEAFVACYAPNKTMKTASFLPMVTPVAESRFYTPNRLLIDILKHYMFNSDTETIEHPGNLCRWKGIMRVMAVLGYPTIDTYAKAFNDWKVPIDTASLQKLSIYSAIFQSRKRR
jgi:hypothetical protein